MKNCFGDYIDIRWHIEDVKSRDEDLTDDQCMKVLEYIKLNHDAEIGVNWDVIDFAIQVVIYGG